MTYAEIYDEICQLCFPGVAVPDNMPAYIRGKIRNAQRMINRDYNFWFTLSSGSIATAPGTQSYNLPSDFKEIEEAYFSVFGQSYGTDPLSLIDITEHITMGLQKSSQQAEYPSKMRIDGTSIHLYPIPSDTRVLNILYWRFLDLVPIDTEANFRAYAEDSIGLYCGEAIVNYVTSLVKLAQNEWQSATIYKQLYLESIESAMQEDKARRQIPLNVAPYYGGSSNGSVL